METTMDTPQSPLLNPANALGALGAPWEAIVQGALEVTTHRVLCGVALPTLTLPSLPSHITVWALHRATAMLSLHSPHPEASSENKGGEYRRIISLSLAQLQLCTHTHTHEPSAPGGWGCIPWTPYGAWDIAGYR